MDGPAPDDPRPPTASPAGDDQLFLRYGAELADAVEAALGPWVEAAVAARLGPDRVANPDPGLRQRIDRAAGSAVDEVGGRLRDLLVLDLDQQWTNPLTLIRQAVAYPTAVLAEAGVPPVDRTLDDARLHPDDVYGLTPAAFADFGPEVHERGLRWGAAKAHLHLQRRRQGGARPPAGEA